MVINTIIIIVMFISMGMRIAMMRMTMVTIKRMMMMTIVVKKCGVH